MCGGGTTQTSTVSIPPEVLANYQKVFGLGEQISSKPFQAYSQDPNAFVAGMTPTQQAALQNVNAIQGMAGGDVAAGQGMMGAGAQLGGQLQQASLGTTAEGQNIGSQLYGSSLGSIAGGRDVGGQLYGRSLGNVEQGQNIGRQLYGDSFNAIGRGQGIGEQLYGSSLGAASQGQDIGRELYGNSLSSVGRGQGTGENLYGRSLETAAYGQGVGGDLYGRSLGVSETGLGAASGIYGRAVPQISQAAQVGQRYGQDAASNLYAGMAQAQPFMGEAANLTRAGLGAGQQYSNLAGGYLGAGTQNVGVGELDTARYMSPYTEQVVKATQALQAQENEAQRSALKGDAIRAGAFGGDRAGIAQANLARQQSLANQSTLANVLQQGFSQAQGVAGQQQQLGLSAEQANRAAQQFGAQQASAMGQQQFGQSLSAAQQQAALGQALYGQNIGQGQALAGLGQQMYGQGLGAAQAEAGLGKDIYGMSAQQAQIQQAAAQGMFGQAAQLAALQQSGAQGVFGQAAQQAQLQQAAAQGMFGQGAQIAALQQAAAQGVFGQSAQQAQLQQAGAQGMYGQSAQTAGLQQAAAQGAFSQAAQQAQLQQAAAQGMYGQAAQTAGLQQAAGNNMFNYGLQGGQGVANLGLANQQAQLAAAQAQMQSGQVQQQTDQAGKTALYNQFTQQQGFPYQQVQFLGNLAMGTGALSGSTTTTNSSGGGFFSDRRLKENVEKIGKTYDGQPIYRYNYKGEKATQIGLMADESDKKAVGHSQGYKTLDYKKATEKAANRGHFYAGGLVPASMGGSVGPGNAYEGYARGGYAEGGSSSSEIENYYQKELGRTGSPEEYAYWNGLAEQGYPLSQIQQLIAKSEEGTTYDVNAGVTPGINNAPATAPAPGANGTGLPPSYKQDMAQNYIAPDAQQYANSANQQLDATTPTATTEAQWKKQFSELDDPRPNNSEISSEAEWKKAFSELDDPRSTSVSSGVNNTPATAPSKIQNYYQEELGRTGSPEELAYWEGLASQGTPVSDIQKLIAKSEEGTAYDVNAGVTPGVNNAASVAAESSPVRQSVNQASPVIADTRSQQVNAPSYDRKGGYARTTDEDGNTLYRDEEGRTLSEADYRDQFGYDYEPKSQSTVTEKGKIDPRINQAYQESMFRNADPAGAEYWQGELDKGMRIEDIRSGISGSRERQLVNQTPLTYDASRFQPAAAPVMNRYGAASAPMGSYASSFQPQPAYSQPSYGGLVPHNQQSGYGQQYGYTPQYGYGQQYGAAPQYGYGSPQASGKGVSGGGYAQPAQGGYFNQGYGQSYGQGYGQGYMGGYQAAPQASGKGVGPSSYQSNYGYSNPSSMGAPAPQASGKGPSSSPSTGASSGGQSSSFRRGGRAGYLAGGIVDPNDLSALAAQRLAQLAPHAAGMPGQSLPGAQTGIPNKLMHVPKLITSNARMPEQRNAIDQAMSMAGKVDALGKSFDKGGIFGEDRAFGKALRKGGDYLSEGASKLSAGDRPAAGASPSEYVSGQEGEYFIPEYLEEPAYAKGGLVPGYAFGGGLPYGGGESGGGYIPEEFLEQQQIQALPRDSEQLKAAGAKATSGGLGDVMKAGNLGYKLAPDSLKAGMKSLLPGAEAAAPAAAAAEGLGAAAPAAAEAAAGLGAAAGAGEAAAGLGALAGAGEAAAGIGAAASAAAPIAAAGAEGLTALLAFLPFLSDRRAKENIEPVGKTYDGQTIYRYNYKGDSKTQIGLIAQEVEKKHKNAVGSSNGMKTVDYKRATEVAADRGHFYNGGLIPYRQGYADGMTVDEADLPAIGAQDVAMPAGRMSDEDYAIRTIAAEMGGKSPEEARGIAAVIENRLKSGRWGEGYKDVVTARNQFEPWNKPEGPNYPMRFAADSPRMQMARAAFEGRGDDPTGGALHFYAPAAQAILAQTKGDRAAEPSWARGRDATDIATTRFVRDVDGAPRPPRDIPDRTLAGQAVAAAKQPSAVAPAPAPEKKDDSSFPIRPPATARGKEQDWSDFLTSKQFILPALTAIGTMGTTPTRNLGTALSAGLLGGVTSYQNLDKSQVEIEKAREEIPKITAGTGEIEARTKGILAGLYERQFVPYVGEFVIDKSNPFGPRVQVTDKNLKPIPNTGFEAGIDKIPYAKDSPRPDGRTAPAAGKPASPKAGEASAAPVLNEDTIPKLESKNAVDWNSKTELPEEYLPREHLNINLDPKLKQTAATKDVPRVKEYTEKASSAKEQLMQIEGMQRQYDLLAREGFLTPGAAAEQRLKLANSVNTFLRAAGADPIFPEKDTAALESMMKDTFRLGATLSNSIGTREPGVIVQQAVKANPGIENSPDGFRVILAGMKENAQYMKDRGDFYSRYFDRFGHLSGADRAFESTNPSDMYARRSVVTAIQSSPDFPAGTIDALKKYGPDAAPKDRPELSIRNKIDGKYGAGTTDYILGKK